MQEKGSAPPAPEGQDIKDKGSTPPPAPKGQDIKEYGTPIDTGSPIKVVNIIGQIEGHMNLPPGNKTTKYEHLLPMLVDIEQDDKVKGILLLMNTAGGDVEAGLAIAEMVAGMSTPSVSLVIGGGHSIGVTLAVSADYSIISPTASMTVHPIRMTGLIIGVPQTFDYFNKMQQRIVRFVSEHSRIDEDGYRRLMLQTGELANDVGTVLVGKETVEYGIIDSVGTFQTAMKKIKEMANI